MKVLIIFILTFIASCKMSNTPMNLIKDFDVNKYLGQWYEIARVDNRFEKGCTDVTANYSLRQDGGLNVVNKCLVDGKEKIATGRAYFRKDKNIGSLKVTFFWPFYGNYNIVYLDNEYQYAVIDGGSKEYLWILGRKATIDNKTLKTILEKIKQDGLQTDYLIYTQHHKKIN